MKQKGCLIICIVLFAFVTVAWAFGVIGQKEEVRTPDYYEVNVRAMFKRGAWDEGKALLDEGLKVYPEVNGLNELNGQYYYHKKDYDNSRYFLVRAVRDNPSNVDAKQLLVKVEEETKNYSSAICYVNELLEINPYWKGLWRKKIGLYRLQGNDVEADRLLKRLHQIYPNDTALQKEFAYNLEEQYIRKKKSGKPAEAIKALYELVEAIPGNEAYYMDLTNLLLQQGNTEEALEVSGRGVSRIPGSTALVIKRAGILAGEGRYQEALAFVQSRMRFNGSARLRQFHTGLLAEAANAAKMGDPYVLYGKLYETTKSNEALDYMLNTSVTRGYDDDALYYIAEAKRRRGEQFSLLYKEYLVYKRMGNTPKAQSLLNRLAAMQPDDADLGDEMAMLRLDQASGLISSGLYSEALPYAMAAASHSSDPEVRASALSRTYSCYYETKQYDRAMNVLDSLFTLNADTFTYTIRKADVLKARGDVPQALAMLDSAIQDTAHLEYRPAYCSAYEEMAVPYIKGLIEEGATRRAFDASVALLKVNPASPEGLQFALGTADMLGSYAAYDLYVAQARSIYPERTDFAVKQAAAYNRNGEYHRSIDMLRPWLDDYPDNQAIVGAFSESSEAVAYQLVKAHLPAEAVAVIDTALVFDDDNQALFYAKGTAYEAMHDYDSAYHYLRKYVPGEGEAAAHERHLMGLDSRSLKNEIAVEYLQGRYGEEDVITAVATAAYTRRFARDLLTARVNYAGRDGAAAGDNPEDQVPGGVGLQFGAEWEHQISDRWSATLAGAYGTRYFPKLMASAKLAYNFPSDVTVDLHAAYRRIHTYSKLFAWAESDVDGEGSWAFDGWEESGNNLFNVGAGVSKAWDRLILSGRLDGFLMSSHIYANATAQLKYFPLEDGRTSVTVTGSVGSAPEANLIDNAMPGTFDKLNSMVGLGGIYMINKHLSVGLMGTWQTFYSQVNQRGGDAFNYTEWLNTKYRNLYNVHVQLYVHF